VARAKNQCRGANGGARDVVSRLASAVSATIQQKAFTFGARVAVTVDICFIYEIGSRNIIIVRLDVDTFAN